MKIQLKNVRLNYSKGLFHASAFDADSDAKYNGDFIFAKDSPNLKIIVDAIQSEATREWGEKGQEILKSVKASGKIWCLRDGDAKVNKDGNPIQGYPGNMFVSAKNTIRPLLIGGGPDGRGAVAEEDGVLYSGCFVNVILDVRAGSKPSKQVWAYLLGVQKCGDGDSLGGVTAAADDFEAIPGTEAATTGANGGSPKSAEALFG